MALKTKTLLAIISLLLLVWVFYMIHRLSKNHAVRECFSSFDKYFRPNNPYGPLIDKGCPDTTHDVQMPINTTFSCENKCSTTGRCYVTGQQCMADIDCPGCNPYGSKKVGGMTYDSSLTSSFADSAEIINPDPFSPAPLISNGVDTWSKQAQQDQQLFDLRYKQSNTNPAYLSRFSLTGEFLEDGPIPGNYIPFPPNPPSNSNDYS
jgi:hypothetical protein